MVKNLNIYIYLTLISLLIPFLFIYFNVFTSLDDYLIGFHSNNKLTRLSEFEIALIGIMGFWITWAMMDVIYVKNKVFIFISSIVIVFGFYIIFLQYNIFFSPFGSILTIIISSIVGGIFTSTSFGSKNRILNEIVKKRISNLTYKQILSSNKKIPTSASFKFLSVVTFKLFSDKNSEDSGGELRKYNFFRKKVSDFLISNNAYIDDSQPNEVRSYFGIFEDESFNLNYCSRKACEIAIKFREYFLEVNDQYEYKYNEIINYGIGISSGKFLVGPYKFQDGYYVSAVGEGIEKSRRLARSNNQFSSNILIGPEVYSLISNKFEVRPMEMIYDVDNHLMIEVYELLNFKFKFSKEEELYRDIFWEAVILFREKNYLESMESFNKIKDKNPNDKTIDYFLSKINSCSKIESNREFFLDGKINNESKYYRNINQT